MSVVLSVPRCPLCESERVSVYHTATRGVPWRLYGSDERRGEGLRFFQCHECSLISKDPTVRATPSQERAHYEKHNNDLANQGYRDHLLMVVTPLASYLPPGALGLDYGCGPVLSIEPLMRELGVACVSYDPIFATRQELLTSDTYDYISCCEVVEHFTDPRREFDRLHAMLKKGGVLGIKTRLVPEDFSTWWYHRDPTHVVFYSERTFDWIAVYFGFELLEHHEGIALMRKRELRVRSQRLLTD
jgi:hypothetical protein